MNSVEDCVKLLCRTDDAQKQADLATCFEISHRLLACTTFHFIQAACDLLACERLFGLVVYITPKPANAGGTLLLARLAHPPAKRARQPQAVRVSALRELQAKRHASSGSTPSPQATVSLPPEN